MAFWSKKDGKNEAPSATPPSRPAPAASQQPVAPEASSASPRATPSTAAAMAPPGRAATATAAATERPKASNGAAPADAPRTIEFRPTEKHAIEFGKIAIVLLASPRHRAMPLGEVFAQVMPCMLSGQYAIAGAKAEGKETSDPIGVVMWASVSDEVDKRMASNLSAPMALAPAEWRSGDHIWIIDAVGPGKIIEAMLNKFATGPFKDKPMKMRRKGDVGSIKIETWPIKL